jgi:hypothetical protein
MKLNIIIICISILFLSLFSACIGTKEEAVPTNVPETATSVPEKTVELKTGDMVAAPWECAYYLGKIESITGDKANVFYEDDKKVREVNIQEIKSIEKKVWKAGDKVMAPWKDFKFYNGTIKEEKSKDSYIVEWEDGSPAIEIKSELIISPIKPECTKEEGNCPGTCKKETTPEPTKSNCGT